jgi:peptide/nickel transport system permease protein
MLGYLLRRALVAVPVLLGVTVVVFIVIDAMPGDVVDFLVNPQLSGEAVQAQREALGLHQPLHVRYFTWLGQLAHGNLGYSLVNRQPVTKRIGERLGPTLLLMGAAILGGVLLAIPMGTISAIHQYSAWDYSLTALAFVSISMPTFFLGLGLIYVFSLKLDLFPVAGMQMLGAAFSLTDRLHHLVLPATVLGLVYLARFIRFMRSGMLEVLNEDYVRTARSKGLAESVVVFKHALRNALLPVITLWGLTLPEVFGGAVITEQIFQWPGIGMLTIESILARDYPTLMGMNLVTALLVVTGGLLADVAYAVADPRIRYE